ncbi:hypothetical protein PIB30_022727, partial [Stylosanthes scabra]|nr:hypothetical protein [Stylosanthes scabra]
QLKALLNLIGCEGEGRHRGEEERKKKKKKEEERRGRKKGSAQEEEQQTAGKFCDKSEKMLRRRWGRKQPPVAKELPEEGASMTIQSPEIIPLALWRSPVQQAEKFNRCTVRSVR